GEATRYLIEELKGKTVGFGGSMTVKEMGLFEQLGQASHVFWHWNPRNSAPNTLGGAAAAEVYISSANGIAETGEIINIDGTGNRVAATIYGHKKVIFVIGKNKITPTVETAIDRARNVAAPLNARRLARKTPCSSEADQCFDCESVERICSVLSLFYKKPGGSEYEIILINEDLGF
ncbi:MAG: lactate utilization protein, partial [Bacillota bacterium]|nr:lactate utilization protein [Bacillota bacterium]